MAKKSTTATTSRKKEIASKYVTLAKKLKKLPTMTEFTAYGVTTKTVRYHFNNLTNLRSYAARYADTKRVLNKFASNAASKVKSQVRVVANILGV